MRRTWLTALVPIALACTSLQVESAASEHGCLGPAELASDADDRISGEFVGSAGVFSCDSTDSSKQVSHVATNYDGAIQTFSIAPEPSFSALPGLASPAFLRRQVSDVKPLIRRKPP